MMNTRRTILCVCLCGAAAGALADPPAGYYDSITGTDGVTIKSQLTTLTNQAFTRSYNDARFTLQIIDEDPDNTDNVLLVYNNASVTSTWDSGATWNREHTWPQSLGVGSSGADYSDLHMLRPCNPSVNSSRGNKKFGTSAGQWDPDRFGFSFRGEMARIVFYANTRYTYLNLATIGLQSQFIDWHFDQMPGAEDNIRNDRVYVYQQNRNPYADRPEWVWAVYGDSPSDARLTIAGAAETDGATNASVDLGTFIDGGVPVLGSVQIDKAGAAPTTYRVTASGDVASDADTGYQAGFGRNAQSVAVPFQLVGGPGPQAGTITIDNTDVTSAGAGYGVSDGDDVITVTGFALEPSVASFDPSTQMTSAVLDLGEIRVGQSSQTAVTVWNLAPGATGAALDIDGLSITGLADGVTLTGAPVLGTPAGSGTPLTLTVAPSAAGTINATTTIDVSDEDVPGATNATLTLTVLAEASERCPADVNGDGLVAPDDFNAWILAFTTQAPECDANGDGLCLPEDFNAWIFAYQSGC